MKKLVICSIILLTLTGCTLPFMKNEYNNELANIFSEDQAEIDYRGLAEYGHFLSFQAKCDTESKVVFYYSGLMNDGLTSEEERRTFKVKYIVDDEKVIEEYYDNNDTYLKNSTEITLNSIVPNQVVLKLPLEVNNSWTQEFEYNNVSYKATTTIISIDEIDSESRQYKTELIVEDIEGFFEDIYKEVKVFETNEGLISFQNTMKEVDAQVSGEPEEIDFIFGYRKNEEM